MGRAGHAQLPIPKAHLLRQRRAVRSRSRPDRRRGHALLPIGRGSRRQSGVVRRRDHQRIHSGFALALVLRLAAAVARKPAAHAGVPVVGPAELEESRLVDGHRLRAGRRLYAADAGLRGVRPLACDEMRHQARWRDRQAVLVPGPHIDRRTAIAAPRNPRQGPDRCGASASRS